MDKEQTIHYYNMLFKDDKFNFIEFNIESLPESTKRLHNVDRYDGA